MTSSPSHPAAPVDPAEPVSAQRRLALKRLGLAAGAVYLAPTVFGLYNAGADDNSGPSSSSAGGPKWNKPSKPAKVSKPSKPSKPSKK